MKYSKVGWLRLPGGDFLLVDWPFVQLSTTSEIHSHPVRPVFVTYWQIQDAWNKYLSTYLSGRQPNVPEHGAAGALSEALNHVTNSYNSLRLVIIPPLASPTAFILLPARRRCSCSPEPHPLFKHISPLPPSIIMIITGDTSGSICMSSMAGNRWGLKLRKWMTDDGRTERVGVCSNMMIANR